MGLLVTLFLSLTALLVSTINNSPEVQSEFISHHSRKVVFQVAEGITALAAWVLVHFFFIFGAIVVYMFQLTLVRMALCGGGLRDVEKEARAWRIDLSMLVIFVSMYALFNAVYWPVCLSKQF